MGVIEVEATVVKAQPVGGGDIQATGVSGLKKLWLIQQGHMLLHNQQNKNKAPSSSSPHTNADLRATPTVHEKIRNGLQVVTSTEAMAYAASMTPEQAAASNHGTSILLGWGWGWGLGLGLSKEYAGSALTSTRTCTHARTHTYTRLYPVLPLTNHV